MWEIENSSDGGGKKARVHTSARHAYTSASRQFLSEFGKTSVLALLVCLTEPVTSLLPPSSVDEELAINQMIFNFEPMPTADDILEVHEYLELIAGVFPGTPDEFVEWLVEKWIQYIENEEKNELEYVPETPFPPEPRCFS